MNLGALGGGGQGGMGGGASTQRAVGEMLKHRCCWGQAFLTGLGDALGFSQSFWARTLR